MFACLGISVQFGETDSFFHSFHQKGSSLYHAIVENSALQQLPDEVAFKYAQVFRPRHLLATGALAAGSSLFMAGRATGDSKFFHAAAADFLSHFILTALMVPSIKVLRDPSGPSPEFRSSLRKYIKLHWMRTVGVGVALLLWFT